MSFALLSGHGIADSGGPALKVRQDQLVSRLQLFLTHAVCVVAPAASGSATLKCLEVM